MVTAVLSLNLLLWLFRRFRPGRRLALLGSGGPLSRRREDLVHAVARAFGRGFYHSVVGDVRLQTLEQAVAEVHARHLAAAELHRRLDLVPLGQEAQQALELHR